MIPSEVTLEKGKGRLKQKTVIRFASKLLNFHLVPYHLLIWRPPSYLKTHKQCLTSKVLKNTCTDISRILGINEALKIDVLTMFGTTYILSNI